jgi:hypothetical protein
MHPLRQMDARSGQSDCGDHFLHTNVILRHACCASGEAEEHIDNILTQAAVLKRRVWVSSMLFAELRPSMFTAGRFNTVHEFTRYIRSLVTLVTPDPNTMLRVGRLRDAKWQRPAGVRGADEKPRMMSFTDAVQIASALWVKEAGGVPDLKFLMFDDLSSNEAKGRARLSLLRLLCRGCARQFGRHGGSALDPHSAFSSGALHPAIGAGRTRVQRNLLRAALIKRTDGRAGVSGIPSNSVDELVSQP